MKPSTCLTPVLAAVIMAALPAAMAQAPSLDARLSTNVLHVGDRVMLEVDVAHPGDERVLVPDISRDPVIVVWDTRSDRRDLDEQRRETRVRIAFSSFVIGEHPVATNALTILKADGSEEKLPLPDLWIRVDSLLTNPPPSLADIKPPARLPGQAWRRAAWIMAAIVLVALAAGLLARWWMYKPKPEARERKIPPHEVALTALEALLRRGHLEQGNAEPFYVELSTIVRVYLEDRFELHAPEQTTEEFIRDSSRSQALSIEHRQLTQSFLEQSDLVKFARLQPGGEDMQRAWEAAARLVRETIPTPSTGASP